MPLNNDFLATKHISSLSVGQRYQLIVDCAQDYAAWRRFVLRVIETGEPLPQLEILEERYLASEEAQSLIPAVFPEPESLNEGDEFSN